MIPQKIVSSGVIEWPVTGEATTVTCIICGNPTALENAKTGACYADGRQAFACLDHAWNNARWVVSWLRFSEEQLQQQGRND